MYTKVYCSHLMAQLEPSEKLQLHKEIFNKMASNDNNHDAFIRVTMDVHTHHTVIPQCACVCVRVLTVFRRSCSATLILELRLRKQSATDGRCRRPSSCEPTERLPACLSVCLPACLSVGLSAGLPVCLCVRVNVPADGRFRFLLSKRRTI